MEYARIETRWKKLNVTLSDYCVCVCASVWVLCVHFSEHNEQSLGEFGKLNFESWNVGHFKGDKC